MMDLRSLLSSGDGEYFVLEHLEERTVWPNKPPSDSLFLRKNGPSFTVVAVCKVWDRALVYVALVLDPDIRADISENRTIALAPQKQLDTLWDELLLHVKGKYEGLPPLIAEKFDILWWCPGVVGEPSDCLSEFCLNKHHRIIYVVTFLVKSSNSKVMFWCSENSFYFCRLSEHFK